jgi:oxaloacetate decarboxylase alpha subunit
MLTNMESQLREQGASERFDEVLAEIPRVRKDLGYIPLVTPTSQIVGSQAVLNVLMGERYKTITGETAGVLKGEYGATPAPVDASLRARVLGEGEEAITCRPADRLSSELERLTVELGGRAQERSIALAQNPVDDVLIYAMFPQVGLKFLVNRSDPDAFEPPPWKECVAPTTLESAAVPTAAAAAGGPETYRVEVDGHSYRVRVSPEGDLESVTPGAPTSAAAPAAGGRPVPAPFAGTVVQVKVKPGDSVLRGDLILILEAMKMETELRSPEAGRVLVIAVKAGDSVQVGQPLLTLS